MKKTNLFPIAWHVKGLDNSYKTLCDLEVDMERLQSRIFNLKLSMAKTQAQIKRARDEGKASFNPDTYNVPKKA